MATAPQKLNQSDFAKRRNANKATVSKWKAKGLIVFDDDGMVDVEKTEWNLDQRPAKYRGGVTHRPIRSIVQPRVAPSPAKRSSDTQQPDDQEPDETIPDLDPDSTNLPMAEAVRRKENFLGLQRKLDFQAKESALVDRAAARSAFFEAARDNRDAWIAWPARVAVVMASELGIDARALTTVLSTHVQQHLSELGEPTLDIGR